MSEQFDELNLPVVALSFLKKGDQVSVGTSIYFRNDVLDFAEKNHKFEVLDFADNDHLANLDSFLVRLGKCILYVPDDFESLGRLYKSFCNIIEGQDFVVNKVKRVNFKVIPENERAFQRFFGNNSILQVVESEHSLSYGALSCLFTCESLRNLEVNSKEVDIKLGSLNTYMRMDLAACDAINLLPKADDPSKFGSLYGLLNRCKTKIGSKLLMRWIRQPLIDVKKINNRLDIVEFLVNHAYGRSQISDGPLKGVPDVDHLVARMERKNAGLGDAYRLYTFTKSLQSAESILRELLSEEGPNNDISTLMSEKFVVPLGSFVERFSKFQELIEHVVDFSRLPDFYVNPKHDIALQDIQEEIDEVTGKMERLVSVANKTWANGVVSEVKLFESPLHGYVMRSTKGEDERALREANSKIRILQILKTGCYFTTPELEGLNETKQILERDYKDKQQGLIAQCIETALTYVPVLISASELIAELDVFCALAYVAVAAGSPYTRPVLHGIGSSTRKMNLVNARHPCVEVMDNVHFIPNSYNLDMNGQRLQIITGPNMGGKSTYIRGIGCIVALAQIGSFIPCDSGSEVAIVDCILARVGAGDAVQKGVSTFMAEMLEASNILHIATENSLIIIDELGRGTSTFDGFGLAWAISEYICQEIRCFTMFASHFHELTALSHTYTSVSNRHVTAHVDDKHQLTMLYQVQDGPCKESYGIHVAKMASFPNAVINEAKRKAVELEGQSELRVADVEVDDKLKANKMMKFAELPLGNICDLSAESARNRLVEVDRIIFN